MPSVRSLVAKGWAQYKSPRKLEYGILHPVFLLGATKHFYASRLRHYRASGWHGVGLYVAQCSSGGFGASGLRSYHDRPLPKGLRGLQLMLSGNRSRARIDRTCIFQDSGLSRSWHLGSKLYLVGEQRVTPLEKLLADERLSDQNTNKGFMIGI